MASPIRARTANGDTTEFRRCSHTRGMPLVKDARGQSYRRLSSSNLPSNMTARLSAPIGGRPRQYPYVKFALKCGKEGDDLNDELGPTTRLRPTPTTAKIQ